MLSSLVGPFEQNCIKTLSRLECKNMLQINFGLIEKCFVTVTFACWNDINNGKREEKIFPCEKEKEVGGEQTGRAHE
jgi:hypothetical protein